MFAASNSDTIVKSSEITSKREDEHVDLRSWMDRNGLPPCKVMLKDRPSHDPNLRPIHYVAASEDLQVNSSRWLIVIIVIAIVQTELVFFHLCLDFDFS